jgi:hypothetical protein
VLFTINVNKGIVFYVTSFVMKDLQLTVMKVHYQYIFITVFLFPSIWA